ncbi:MAG: hypothetical protein M0D55_09075 [Elusimicrobiota bacterium]|nr:MAG: hypothetical protein M0D55_09075 [Elusimicrobiota bacterium]
MAIEDNRRTWTFGAVGAAALLGAVLLQVRSSRLNKKVAACKALSEALDKTVRDSSPRIFEGIVDYAWDRKKERCLASIEYHYKPCDPKTAKKNPELCAGPDADIGIYAFLDGGAKPLVMCERRYEPAAAACTESVYGIDGMLLTSREFPRSSSPLKDELFDRRP